MCVLKKLAEELEVDACAVNYGRFWMMDELEVAAAAGGGAPLVGVSGASSDAHQGAPSGTAATGGDGARGGEGERGKAREGAPPRQLRCCMNAGRCSVKRSTNFKQ